MAYAGATTIGHGWLREQVMSNQPERLSGETIAVLDNGEASRRETEQRFRLAAEAAREAIWDWDLCKDLVWRSEGFQTLFGYAADEVSTDFDWWAARIHPHDLEKICCHVPPRTASGAPRNEMQYRFRRSDGTYADVADRWLVIRGPDRRAVRVVGSIADISERRHAEHLAHLRHVEQGHIARANTVGEMAKGLAHELNQPLTAIANYAESCAQVILTGAPGREEKLLLWIEKIVVNSQRAGTDDPSSARVCERLGPDAEDCRDLRAGARRHRPVGRGIAFAEYSGMLGAGSSGRGPRRSRPDSTSARHLAAQCL